MRTIRELIDASDPTDANYCLDVLEAMRKLAHYGQLALDSYNGKQLMGRDLARELSVSILNFGSLLNAFEYPSPSGEEVAAFREEVRKP